MANEDEFTNVGTSGHVDYGSDVIIFNAVSIEIPSVSPLIIEADHGKRAKKGKRLKDWQLS